MKCLIVLALVAVAAAESNFPFGFPSFGQQGFPFAHHGQRTPYNHFQQQMPIQHQQQMPFQPMMPFQHHQQQMRFQPYHHQQQRVFRREAESDSKSFYPGFPYMPPTPYYGHQQQTPFYNQHQTPFYNQHQTPYFHQQSPYFQQPQMVRPYTSYSHPMMYNPLLKVAEEKFDVKEHSVEKRESESDSFYPGYPYMPPTPYYGHHQQHQAFAHPMQQQAYAHPGQTYGLPSMVPRVLPYNFPGMYNNYHNSPYYRPAFATAEKETVKSE